VIQGMPLPHASAAPRTSGKRPSAVIVGAGLALAWSVLAFGGVYPWAYWPLLALVAAVGVAGIVQARRDVFTANRRLTIAIVAIAMPILIQLVPLPRDLLLAISPQTDEMLRQIDLGYASTPAAHPISLDPFATVRALAGFACISLFALGVSCRLSRQSAAGLVVATIVLGVVVSLVAIVQRSVGSGLIYGFWKPLEGGIPYGPFVNRNHFAGWMVMVVSLSLGELCRRTAALATESLPDWRSRILWLSSADASKVILLAAAVACMSVALVLTLSRSGIAAFAAALVVMGMFVRRHDGSTRHKFALGAYVSILVVVGILAAGAGAIVQRFAAANWTELGDRRTAWAISLDMARDFPLTGTGINTFGYLSPVYTGNRLPVHYGEAHNDYLQLAAEGGVLVGVPLTVGLWLIVVEVRRRFRAGDRAAYWVRAGAATGVAAMAFQEVVDFSLQIPANALCFAMLLAIAIHAPRPRAQVSERRDSYAPPRWPSRR
jgi:O-antigen ligase